MNQTAVKDKKREENKYLGKLPEVCRDQNAVEDKKGEGLLNF